MRSTASAKRPTAASISSPASAPCRKRARPTPRSNGCWRNGSTCRKAASSVVSGSTSRLKTVRLSGDAAALAAGGRACTRLGRAGKTRLGFTLRSSGSLEVSPMKKILVRAGARRLLPCRCGRRDLQRLHRPRCREGLHDLRRPPRKATATGPIWSAPAIAAIRCSSIPAISGNRCSTAFRPAATWRRLGELRGLQLDRTEDRMAHRNRDGRADPLRHDPPLVRQRDAENPDKKVEVLVVEKVGQIGRARRLRGRPGAGHRQSQGQRDGAQDRRRTGARLSPAAPTSALVVGERRCRTSAGSEN